MAVYKKAKFLMYFFVILFLYNLSACKENNSIPPKSEINETYTSNTVYIHTEKTEYTAKEKYIRYIVANESDSVFSFDNSDEYNFILQRYEDGKWEDYPFGKKRFFPEYYIEYSIATGEEATNTINLKQHFNTPLKKGYYRILWFEFTSNVFKIT